MNLRLLANENVPRDVVEGLRTAGHDVRWVADTPGLTDEQVLELAASEQRLLLTFDKDFGELAFRCRLPAASGIVLVRVALRSPSSLATAVVEALGQPREWGGHFSVVEHGLIRTTPLPVARGPDH